MNDKNRHPGGDTRCPLCNHEYEDREHFLLMCDSLKSTRMKECCTFPVTFHQSTVEKLDFNKSDWPNLCLSLMSIDCSVFHSDKPIEVCIDELIDEIGNKCSIHVPLNEET